MGTLNRKEKELLSEIVESIEDELSIINQGFINSDRLAYLTCLNENDKIEYTKQEIRKLQEGFKACNPDISEYIFALIQKHPFDNCTHDEKQKQIIGNFILDLYFEEFELLIKPGNNKSLSEKSFRECIEGLKFETGLLDEFIHNVANANRFLTLSSFIVEPDITIKAINSEQNKKTLKQHKQNIDTILNYYSCFFMLINAIKRFDTNQFENCISELKTLEIPVIYNKQTFFEEIPFDLTADEIQILNRYSANKLQQIEDTFKLISDKIEDHFDNANLNRTFHEIWHTKSDLGNMLILYTSSYENFIKTLFETLTARLKDFHNELTKLFFDINKLSTPSPENVAATSIISENSEKGKAENPYPEIFTSPKGFKIFTRFKEKIPFIESPNSEYADYSFLFNSLKKDKFIHDVKHKTFLDFLDKHFKVAFAKTYTQFKFSTTRQKKDAYATCKQQFH